MQQWTARILSKGLDLYDIVYNITFSLRCMNAHTLFLLHYTPFHVLHHSIFNIISCFTSIHVLYHFMFYTIPCFTQFQVLHNSMFNIIYTIPYFTPFHVYTIHSMFYTISCQNLNLIWSNLRIVVHLGAESNMAHVLHQNVDCLIDLQGQVQRLLSIAIKHTLWYLQR